MAPVIEAPDERQRTKDQQRVMEVEAPPPTIDYRLPTLAHRPSTADFRRIAALWLADLATGVIVGLLILAIVLCVPLGDRAIRFVYAGF